MRWVNLLGSAATALASAAAVVVVGLLDPATEVNCPAPTPVPVTDTTVPATPSSSGTGRHGRLWPPWPLGDFPAQPWTTTVVGTGSVTAVGGGTAAGSVTPTALSVQIPDECRTTDAALSGALP